MPTFDDGVLVLRRSKLVLAASAMPIAAGAALACTGQPSAVALGIALAWLGLGGVAYAWARNPDALPVEARAHADSRGLFLDGRVAIDAARVTGGWIEPRSDAPPLVHLRAGPFARRLTMAMRDVESARDLLRALGLDASHVAAAYWTMSRPLGEPRSFARAATIAALVFALGVVAGQAAPAALALAVIALAVLFAGVVAPTAVTVGADGLLLRWLGTERFVAWADVAAIEPFDGGIVVATADGQWLTMRMPPNHERHHPERDAMVERMRQAWIAGVRAAPDEATAGILRRAGTRTRDWVGAMRAIVRRRDAGYRVAAVPEERLWRVVEDPRADRFARTGAAIALAPTLDDAGRERLRTAASGCAEPRLRVALATAASPVGASAPDDELAATLDAIESEGKEPATP